MVNKTVNHLPEQ